MCQRILKNIVFGIPVCQTVWGALIVWGAQCARGWKKIKKSFLGNTYLGVKIQSWLFSLNNGEKIRSKSFTKRKLQACELNLSEAKKLKQVDKENYT